MTLKEETIPTAALYGLLASVFLAEIGPELLTRLRSPEFQQIFEELDVNLGEEFFRVEQEPLLEALAVEYSGLFIGPGHFISPHESVHHVREDGDYGKLWGADTVAVKKFIEATGLSYDQQFTGMPDHVGAELEFVQKLLEASHEATQKHDAELAGNLLGIKNPIATIFSWTKKNQTVDRY